MKTFELHQSKILLETPVRIISNLFKHRGHFMAGRKIFPLIHHLLGHLQSPRGTWRHNPTQSLVDGGWRELFRWGFIKRGFNLVSWSGLCRFTRNPFLVWFTTRLVHGGIRFTNSRSSLRPMKQWLIFVCRDFARIEPKLLLPSWWKNPPPEIMDLTMKMKGPNFSALIGVKMVK